MNMQNVEAKYLAIGPLDGRYHDISESLAPYFSEFALMCYRVRVEVEWLIFLGTKLSKDDLSPAVVKLDLNDDFEQTLRSLYTEFSGADMAHIKAIEARTNHDVKAVELFIDDRLDQWNLSALKPLVHIGCTSEDINNLAYALMLKEGLNDVWWRDAVELFNKLNGLAHEWSEIPMLAHTHGQPATPTTLGKEIRVMATRLDNTLRVIGNVSILGKFNGATGTYAAISLAYPNYNWPKLNQEFVEERLGLSFNPCTTQIEPHDWIAEMLDGIRRFNNIMRNIDQDMWTYISMEYLTQKPKEGEVGSSTMPHKVNPIRFENSESNCEMSNCVCQTLSDQLTNSRLQRDLTDSSLIRNVGLAIGYSLQAIRYCLAGLNRIAPGTQKLESDLDRHWEVLAEAIQTVLRKHGIPDAYDQLKEATRGKEITMADIRHFVLSAMESYPEACADLDRLSAMVPRNYIGEAVSIAKEE